jgi:hypothetical protein
VRLVFSIESENIGRPKNNALSGKRLTVTAELTLGKVLTGR